MGMTRKVYLEDVPLAEAWRVFRGALAAAGWWQALSAEMVSVAEANGRVTATAVWARISSPHYHASAMDGYALRAQDNGGGYGDEAGWFCSWLGMGRRWLGWCDQPKW